MQKSSVSMWCGVKGIVLDFQKSLRELTQLPATVKCTAWPTIFSNCSPPQFQLPQCPITHESTQTWRKSSRTILQHGNGERCWAEGKRQKASAALYLLPCTMSTLLSADSSSRTGGHSFWPFSISRPWNSTRVCHRHGSYTVTAVQFSSGCYLHAEESPHALHPITQMFPQCGTFSF